jgi:hypothetical protein
LPLCHVVYVHLAWLCLANQDLEAEGAWDGRHDKSPSRFNDRLNPLLRTYF